MSRNWHVYLDIRSAFIPILRYCSSDTLDTCQLSVNLKHLTPLFRILLDKKEVNYQVHIFCRPEDMVQNMIYKHPLSNAQYGVAYLHSVFKKDFVACLGLPVFNNQRIIVSLEQLSVEACEALLENEKRLLISPDLRYLDAARASGCTVCQTYEGGELNPEDITNVHTAASNNSITSVLLSTDVDETLLLRTASFFVNDYDSLDNRIILNTHLLNFFKTLQTDFKEKAFTYQVLTARHFRDIQIHMEKTSGEMINDYQRTVRNKYSLFHRVCQSAKKRKQLESSEVGPFESELDSFDIEKEAGYFNSLAPIKNEQVDLLSQDWHFLPNIIADAKKELELSSLPAICTGDPSRKHDVLQNALKPGRLIVHFDDDPYVIADLRRRNPSVCVVQVYLPGVLEENFNQIIQQWLMPEAMPEAMPGPLDQALEFGALVRVPESPLDEGQQFPAHA